MNRQLAKTGAALSALGAVVVVVLTLGSIDWSAFTDALTAVIPDALALAAVLVGGAMTIALVFKGGRAVISWATRFVH
jgi:hypothetical protein